MPKIFLVESLSISTSILPYFLVFKHMSNFRNVFSVPEMHFISYYVFIIHLSFLNLQRFFFCSTQ